MTNARKPTKRSRKKTASKKAPTKKAANKRAPARKRASKKREASSKAEASPQPTAEEETLTKDSAESQRSAEEEARRMREERIRKRVQAREERRRKREEEAQRERADASASNVHDLNARRDEISNRDPIVLPFEDTERWKLLALDQKVKAIRAPILERLKQEAKAEIMRKLDAELSQIPEVMDADREFRATLNVALDRLEGVLPDGYAVSRAAYEEGHAVCEYRPSQRGARFKAAEGGD